MASEESKQNTYQIWMNSLTGLDIQMLTRASRMKNLTVCYSSMFIFQSVFVNLAVVVVQVCEQSFHDILGSEYFGKRETESVSFSTENIGNISNVEIQCKPQYLSRRSVKG